MITGTVIDRSPQRDLALIQLATIPAGASAVTLASSPKRPVTRFTQADLQNGGVMFTHDGTSSQAASFDIVVADRSGASTGASQTVRVAVRG